MRAFWNDRGRGVDSQNAKTVDVKEAGLIWSNVVAGVEGNFFGLVDEQGNVVQFYFDEGIPNDIDDAGHLEIVLVDFPQPQMNGSYATHVRIREVHGLIEKAFREGADFRKFDGLRFIPWWLAAVRPRDNEPLQRTGRASRSS